MVKEYIYSPHYDFYIDWARRSKGYEMRTFHFHKKYEIYYEAEGSRKYFIDSASYIVNPGNIVLIGPDSVHKTGSVEDMAHARYVLNFNADYLSQISGIFPDVNLFSCFQQDIHVVKASPLEQKLVETVLKQFWESRNEDAAKDMASRKLQLAQFLLILDGYAKKAKSTAPEQGKVINETVESVQVYISTHYDQALTLTDIAKQFYISKDYLSKLFKKTTGLNVVEYINSIRLTEAKKLLETTNRRISLIGEDVGFGTTTHFSRVFKGGTGLSPQQYRKLYGTLKQPASSRISP